MPHFEVKLYPGYRPEQLRTLTDHIVQAAVQDLKVPENVVSVAFQEIAPEHWQEQVYQQGFYPFRPSMRLHRP